MMYLKREVIIKYAKKYDENAKSSDIKTEKKFKSLLSRRKFLTKNDLVEIGVWKSPRPRRKYASNNDLAVQELTKFSLSAKSEQARIGALMVLKGVSWPVASTILHFTFPNRYPILDFRVIWSLGWEQPKSYDFDFWWKYVKKLRDLSKKFRIPLRVLDKALWFYSKKNQRKSQKIIEK